MNKSDLCANVAAEASVSRVTADTVASGVFSTVAGALARNEAVTIAAFGTFSTRERAARQGRNPATGESVAIAASKTPAFKAAKKLRAAVNSR